MSQRLLILACRILDRVNQQIGKITFRLRHLLEIPCLSNADTKTILHGLASGSDASLDQTFSLLFEQPNILQTGSIENF